MSPALHDEPAPRSGSATSLVLTLIGLYQRRVGGWLSIADMVALAGALGLSDAATRTGISRLKKRQILAPLRRGGAAGYALSSGALELFGRGDRRIFDARVMRLGDPWRVVSFTLSETQRHVRAQMRRHLAHIGFGQIAPSLWIGPDFLAEEVEDILDALRVRENAVLLRTEQPVVAGDLSDAIREWWDLDAIAALHRVFHARAEELLRSDPANDAEAFARYVIGVDAWREVSYNDPGLPFELLPANWPGREGSAAFRILSDRFAGLAWSHVRQVTGSGDAPPR